MTNPTPYSVGYEFELDGIDSRVKHAAEVSNINASDLDWHLEAEHGWEPHDDGYERALGIAVECAQKSIDNGLSARECME